MSGIIPGPRVACRAHEGVHRQQAACRDPSPAFEALPDVADVAPEPSEPSALIRDRARWACAGVSGHEYCDRCQRIARAIFGAVDGERLYAAADRLRMESHAFDGDRGAGYWDKYVDWLIARGIVARGPGAPAPDAATVERVAAHSSDILVNDAVGILAKALDGCWCDDGRMLPECARCVAIRAALAALKPAAVKDVR
jgi:hypothetical protein